jgi:Rrf2 family iron-sulfur cluster assembly transcriptional regulator
MKLSTKSRYAVMALAYIAKNIDKQPITLQEISNSEKISINFLEQIFLKLRQNNLVESIRGPGGGYQIINNLSEVPISRVFTAVEDSFKMTRCLKGVGCVDQNSKCITHHLWKGMTNNMLNYLNSISLQDIINNTYK